MAPDHSQLLRGSSAAESLLERVDPSTDLGIGQGIRLPDAAKKEGDITMRMLRNGFLAAASSVLLAGAAHAVPLDSTVIPPSKFNLEITSPALGSGSGSGAITGTASTDITITSTNVSTVGSSGTFAVGTFSIRS